MRRTLDSTRRQALSRPYNSGRIFSVALMSAHSHCRRCHLRHTVYCSLGSATCWLAHIAEQRVVHIVALMAHRLANLAGVPIAVESGARIVPEQDLRARLDTAGVSTHLQRLVPDYPGLP